MIVNDYRAEILRNSIIYKCGGGCGCAIYVFLFRFTSYSLAQNAVR